MVCAAVHGEGVNPIGRGWRSCSVRHWRQYVLPADCCFTTIAGIEFTAPVWIIGINRGCCPAFGFRAPSASCSVEKSEKNDNSNRRMPEGVHTLGCHGG